MSAETTETAETRQAQALTEDRTAELYAALLARLRDLLADQNAPTGVFDLRAAEAIDRGRGLLCDQHPGALVESERRATVEEVAGLLGLDWQHEIDKAEARGAAAEREEIARTGARVSERVAAMGRKDRASAGWARKQASDGDAAN